MYLHYVIILDAVIYAGVITINLKGNYTRCERAKTGCFGVTALNLKGDYTNRR